MLDTDDYYLLARPNPNAPVRTNGIRFWGYPTRRRPADVLVVHTGENLPDFDGDDVGAESIAAYASRMIRPASYNRVVDSDSRIRMLPIGFTAFHAVGWNSRGIGLAFATRASAWGSAPPEWVTAILTNGAIEAADICLATGIEPVKITPEIARSGRSGLVGHGELDPERRTDPGAGFPWSRFIGMVQDRVYEDSSPKYPAPKFSEPRCYSTFADAPNGGQWWLSTDGGIANICGAPYYGHLLDPRTLRILSAALGIPTSDITYTGQPVAIETNKLGGYTIWTDEGHDYLFHAGTIAA